MSNQELIAILKDPNTVTAAVEDIFEKVDTDKSGKIDKKELTVGLKGLSKSLNIPPPTEKDIEETLKELDSNGDGQIDRNEMKVLVEALFKLMIVELEQQ